MTISRRVARPLLSGIFLAGGLDQLQHPETKVKTAEAVAVPVANRVPVLPQETADLVRLNGAVQVVAGALLAIGKWPRLAAIALIGSVIPSTIAGHRFWEETDEHVRKQQRTQFLKNLALLGGLILAAVDTEGAPSMGWRARRRARDTATRASSVAQTSTSRATTAVRGGPSRAATKANRAAAHSAAQAQRAIARAQQIDLREAQRRAATVVQGSTSRAAMKANRAAARSAAQAQRAIARAQQIDLREAQRRATMAALQTSQSARQGADVATQALNAGAGQASALLSRAVERLHVVGGATTS